MPKSLKLYVATVVVIGALALVAATFLFPPKPAIAIDLPGPTGVRLRLEYALGIAVLDRAHADRVGVSGSAAPRHATGSRDRSDHGVAVPRWTRSRWLGRRDRHDGASRTSRSHPLVRDPRKSRGVSCCPRSSRVSFAKDSLPRCRRWPACGLRDRDGRGRWCFIAANLTLVSSRSAFGPGSRRGTSSSATSAESQAA